MSKVNIVMDASQYDLFRLCEQRYFYRHKLNLSQPEKPKQLDRGTVVHIGQEYYYQALKDGADLISARTLALSMIRQAGVSSDLDPEEVSRIVDVMEEYYDFWDVADRNLKILEVEKPFLYVLHEDNDVRIHMAGKIDLLYSDERYSCMPMDHKSYDRDFPILELSNQFRNYCVAVNSNYLVVNRIGFQKTLKPVDKFKRVPLSYDDFQLEHWKKNVVKVILYYLQCEAENSWPMNETSCDKYHRKCEYYGLCSTSGEKSREFKINRDFIVTDAWDVSKVLKKASEVLNGDVSR